MRIPLVLVTVMAFATAAAAQQSSTGTRQGSSTQAERSSTQASADSAFAIKAAQANLAEVELGKLAEQKATNDEVKEFAKRMVEDHSKALDELKEIASDKNLTLPTSLDEDHKKLHDRLSKLSGAQFDREYINAMVDGHRKVASDFRKQSQSGSDAELKAYAAKTLPVVEAHLKHAEMIKTNLRSSRSTR